MIYGRRCELPLSPGARLVRGRVVSVSAPTFMLLNEEGSRTVAAGAGDLPECGDIVEVLVDERSRPPEAIRLHRLVVPARNPLDHGDSLFYRLHRDGGRIRKLLLLKARALGQIRAFFSSRDFVEWQTPRLVASPGLEVHLEGFVTHYQDGQGRSRRCYLPTSPEFSLKKALCAGMERIYELCRCFRNGGETGPLHQCEFTMLEWYRAFADYRQIMRDVEELGVYLREELLDGAESVPPFRGRSIDWQPPWPRTSLAEAFARHCGIDLERAGRDQNFFRAEARRLLGPEAEKAEDFESLFFPLFLSYIEPHLGLEKPEILYDYPIGMAALAAAKPGGPALAERFELYVAGVELANGFTELNDPVEQEARFLAALEEKRRRGYPEVPIDTQFLRELGHGMPPSAGIALGVERLLMVLTGTEQINDLLFLPHQWGDEGDQRLWPLGKAKGKPGGQAVPAAALPHGSPRALPRASRLPGMESHLATAASCSCDSPPFRYIRRVSVDPEITDRGIDRSAASVEGDTPRYCLSPVSAHPETALFS
jgi:lysyl-tRNA synthetase class 2